jgi:putative flippase GtrA
MTSAKQPDVIDDGRKKQRRQKERRHADAAPSVPPSITDIAGWVRFFRQLTYMRYLVVSFTALAADLGLFLLFLQAGMNSMMASAIGYTVGIFAHWFLSSRKVFQDRVSERGTAERTQQKAMFLMSALIGLACTTAIVGLGEWLGIDARIAKLVAIIVSFQLTYLLRNVLIFRAARTG